jgi:hypothetical protein
LKVLEFEKNLIVFIYLVSILNQYCFYVEKQGKFLTIQPCGGAGAGAVFNIKSNIQVFCNVGVV